MALMGGHADGAEYGWALVFHSYSGSKGGSGFNAGRSNAHDDYFLPVWICPAHGAGTYFLDARCNLAGNPHFRNGSGHSFWSLAGPDNGV